MVPRGISQGVAPAALVGPEEMARSVGRDDVLRLGSNESPFGPSPRALDAMRAALLEVHRYGDPTNHDLVEALAARHGLSPRHVVVGAGIDDLLGMAVRAWLVPGAWGVCSLGGFPTFDMHVAGYEGRLERVPYAGTRVDAEGLLDAARRCDPAIVYLANPDNPTGSYLSWKALSDWVDRLPDRALLLHDEAYANFLPAGERPPDDWVDPRVIRFRTFSKEYGLAGLRVGWTVASDEAAAALEDVRMLYGINRVGQAAAVAALEDDDFVRGVLAGMARGRVEYEALGRDLGLPTVSSVTNFMLFDCGGRERAEAVMDGLLRRGIHIRKPRHRPLDGYVRISVGRPDERARLAVALRETLTGPD